MGRGWGGGGFALRAAAGRSQVGGTDEYDVCDALKAGRITKPLVAWCIGTCAGAFSFEVQFGHAGACARGKGETAADKNKAMAEVRFPEEIKDPNFVDYLTPFLQNFAKDPRDPTREEAAKSRAACLAALKERLLERANIIQRRLDEENSALSKKQANFQRSRDHMEGADEAFENGEEAGGEEDAGRGDRRLGRMLSL